MAYDVEPAPTDEELAAILAALEAFTAPGPEPNAPSRSRWRAAGRLYDEELAAER